MAFERLPISANMYSICRYISVLKFRWSAQGGTDWIGNIYQSSTCCRFHQIRHNIQVNCTEKWIQFFRSSENETSWDLVPHEKGTNIWGYMYKASIFWYSMLTWDHWEFQLWKVSWHDSQELDFVQRVKEKRPSCSCCMATPMWASIQKYYCNRTGLRRPPRLCVLPNAFHTYWLIESRCVLPCKSSITDSSHNWARGINLVSLPKMWGSRNPLKPFSIPQKHGIMVQSNMQGSRYH
jgi:hypothetical protein